MSTRHLDSISRSRSLALVAQPIAQSIFHEPWWLKIASGGTYEEVTVSSGGVVVGRLPFQASSMYGLKVLSMPLMTYVLGPEFPKTDQNFPNQTKQISITRNLIKKLPDASYVSFRLHGEVTNTLAFESAGFSSTPDFTVEIAPDTTDELWRRMRDKTRNVIRRANERLTITDTIDPNQFLDFYQSNITRKNQKNFNDRGLCEAIISECLRRRTGRLIGTVNSANTLQSAIFTVWDSKLEYYLMSTRDPNSTNGSISLAIWAAMQRAAQNGLTFDMAGIHVFPERLPNIGLLTGFGGTIKPRYRVQRATPAVRLLKSVRDAVT